MAHDELDLQLLQALQLDGRASFGRIAAVLGVSDQTVARRYQKLRTSLRLRVLGIVDETRLGRPSWVVRLHCAPDGAARLADALARRDDTVYVALLNGGTEVTCGIKPRDRQARDDLLLQRLQRTPRVSAVSAHSIIHSFFGGPFHWLSKLDALTGDQQDQLRRPVPDRAGELTLDATDEAIVAALRQDGRTSLRELQDVTRQTGETVRRRLNRLRSAGVLFFDVQYDAEPLGHGTDVMLWITTAPTALTTVGRALAGHPEVWFAAATTGVSNIIVSIRCRDSAHLFTYLSERLGRLDGILQIETAPILRQVKQRELTP
ncbi:Lrp/AsnC family transcriptional regulator [Kineosporia sp. J2-2]|uniref:Lrp/AsnC family transcriptional regulator n=1 Tax=Kineosporia corallincola TaxID=2835133 RepID=A0ABS5TRM3_9ACTN|nr:AsnC family transcriptional regulator [Kineosporia corallincola]MBT0773449.1 Lrp/AsnC family transcriptional regulator [Kineosporia corallincola]